MNAAPIRVAIADDHPVIRLAIEATLANMPEMEIAGVCSSSTDLVALLQAQPCRVLVTDYAMPGGDYGDGLELLTYLREHYPSLAIVVMTGIDRPAIVQALVALGIENILSKADDMSHLPTAVKAARNKRRYVSPSLTHLLSSLHSSRRVTQLSPRELEVLSLFVNGVTIKDIAERLQRSKQTVSTQKMSGMSKLGITKDADLFKHAKELGLGSRPLPLPATGK